jgi:ribonuclease D
MGPKKVRYRGKKRLVHGDPWVHNQYILKRELLDYFTEYRNGCVQFYARTIESQMQQNHAEGGSSHITMESKKKTINPKAKKEYVIGGISFPTLTMTVWSQTYLELPPLNSKQRRLVHEACVECDLFHETCKLRNHDGGHHHPYPWHRIIVVSLYADGFEQVTDLQDQDENTQNPLYKYRPWIIRRNPTHSDAFTPIKSNHKSKIKNNSNNNHPQDDARAHALQAIYALIDQPGDCIRDTIDVLTYDELHAASLADVPPLASNFVLVDTAMKMRQCIQDLDSIEFSELAFDVESYNRSKYTQLTCVLQLCVNGKEYIIDTLADGVWEEVFGLAKFFADPHIVKIGHSIGGIDVRSLHRDFGIFVVNAFDTYEAAQILGLPEFGLAAVCGYYGLPNVNVFKELKQKYQAGDWTVRPMTEPMVQYARYDVHYLVSLRKLMMRDMVSPDYWYNEIPTGEHQLAIHQFEEKLSQIERDEDGLTNIVTPDGKAYRDALDFSFHEFGNGGSQDDDDETYETAIESNNSIQKFYTPSNSFGLWDDEDSNEEDDQQKNDITSADLRLHPTLMRCISLSQERCRDIWKGKSENYFQNELFLDLMKRGKRKQVDWSDWNEDLLKLLYRWREQVAEDMECLPDFVMPINLLISIAWKRPCTVYSLRRIQYNLPVLLKENETYVNQMLDIITQKTFENGGMTSTAVYLRSNLKLNEASSISDRKSSFLDDSYWGVALKIGVASALCAAIVFAVFDERRKRR